MLRGARVRVIVVDQGGAEADVALSRHELLVAIVVEVFVVVVVLFLVVDLFYKLQLDVMSHMGGAF